MGCGRAYLALFVILTISIQFHQCGRFGGTRSGGFNRGSHVSRLSPRPPSSYPRARPSPSPPRPTSRPHEPVARASTSRPVYAQPSHTSRPTYVGSTRRPVYAQPSHTSRPTYVGSTKRPVYAQPPPTSRPTYVGSTRRPFGHGTTPRPHHMTTARWQPPPRPGSPVGPPIHGQTKYKVKYYNTYNYHYPGYYSVPVHNYGFPGYYYQPSYYHYGVGDTGSTALGFFLGYGLAKITTPTYSHHSFYNGYRPQYDHYTVHHYYHNRESVPPKQEIPANTIVGCVGDSSSICPANTTSLCTSNGALMCVASALSTVPCTDNRQVNCVASTISCVNNPAPECKNSNGNTTINIPCVSKANVYGDVKYINNTIIPENATNIGIPSNITSVNNTSTINSTEGTMKYVNNTQVELTTVPHIERTKREVLHSEVNPEVPQKPRKKRDTPKDFCVTVIALPAKRKSTAGEEFLKDAKSLTEAFIENVWGL